jgi:putative ABC transport system substrate-binding protein
MERRGFMAMVGGGLLAGSLAVAVEAQQPGKVHRLGILSQVVQPASSDRSSVAVLLPTALQQLGYAEGQNLLIERRFAEGKRDRLPMLARELVQVRMDVIVAISTDAIRAARDATQTVPIVMVGGGNVVGDGFVASLAHPGSNITGVVISETGLAPKRLQLLKEAVPRATRIAMLAPGQEDYRVQLQEVGRAATSLGVTLVVVEARDGDYERAFASMVAGRATALFVVSSPRLNQDRTRIIALAARHRLPAIYQWREQAEAGGLMAYGSSVSRLSRRLASYVDRILKGASPAELPVEQPSTYELVINLKTAKALGLTIPPALLLGADEVLQ